MSEGDHRWPQAAVAWSGAWITSQRLGWIEVVKAPDPSYKSSGQCQGPQLCIKEFPQRWKVVKQIKYLLKGKKSTIPVDRHTGRLRELQPCSSLNYFHGVFHMGFLWPVILNCLVHSPYLVYLRLEMASLLTQLVKNLPAMWES